MEPEEFKRRLEKIYEPPIDTGETHEDADRLMVEALKDLGYDTTEYEQAVKWYA